MTKKLGKVAVGMSGGVDSSLTAQLLVEQGYDVTGVFLECWRAPGCRSEEDRKDALQVALKLGIPFKVLDFKQTYKDKVVEYFFNEYEAGRTPNPDVMCNVEIKFGLFYDWAMEQGFEYVATGHYAKISHGQLCIPADEHKDQTYFLYRLHKEQLDHILFPLGELTKQQVRTEAKQRHLHVADKKDSVGICFIGDINVHNFLYERLGENPGQVIDTQGNVLGEHKGLWFYTVGQRHGFDINKVTLVTKSDGTTINKHNIPPFYVIKKIPEKNQLMVGFGAETYFDNFEVNDIHWINQQTPIGKRELLVRIRHTGKLIPCSLSKEGEQLSVNLTEPTQGIAEGQSAVFYQRVGDETICLGGGVIG
ncbi:MAG TPA: tRNA 2-thiouridine(34) synthase MnmA [Patescibacteria group bacterium]